MYSLDFPCSYGGPLGQADFRTSEHDFLVDEILGFEPEGSGEHFYLHVKKARTNTQWLAKQLAEFAGVKPVDVGFSGLKDRHAITTQWFSIYMPKTKEMNWDDFFAQHSDNIELLQSSKHTKKLKRGVHQSNNFVITLRQFNVDPSLLEERLTVIKQNGVPNYFGEQRFGIEGNNLVMAEDWLVNKKRLSKSQKGFVMSAARSCVFNQVLAARVKSNSWNSLILGDAPTAAGFPSGPLWGRGRSSCTDDALAMEVQATKAIAAWMEGLEHCGLNQERRSFVLKPQNMSWDMLDEQLQISFSLPPGEFATAVLREIASLKNCSLEGAAVE